MVEGSHSLLHQGYSIKALVRRTSNLSELSRFSEIVYDVTEFSSPLSLIALSSSTSPLSLSFGSLIPLNSSL
jgi:hypothetical protein